MKLQHLKESRDTMLPSYQEVRKRGISFIADNLAGNRPNTNNVSQLADQYLSLSRNSFLTDPLKDSLKKDLIDAFLS